MPTLIYADCAVCGVEAPIITVERDIPHGTILQPEENEDLKVALYGRLPEPGEDLPDIVAQCPNGHALRPGTPIQSTVHE